MWQTLRRQWWPVVLLAIVLVGTGGIASASIPDAGGVIDTCFKPTTTWRPIDTEAGQSCKPGETALDLYSKRGADVAFGGGGGGGAAPATGFASMGNGGFVNYVSTGTVRAFFTCRTDGTSTLAVSSNLQFKWWWDAAFGTAPAGGPGFEQQFTIPNGTGRHSLRATAYGGTTTIDLDTSLDASLCSIGWTTLETVDVLPG
jgi:hypothetical protein